MAGPLLPFKIILPRWLGTSNVDNFLLKNPTSAHTGSIHRHTYLALMALPAPPNLRCGKQKQVLQLSVLQMTE